MVASGPGMTNFASRTVFVNDTLNFIISGGFAVDTGDPDFIFLLVALLAGIGTLQFRKFGGYFSHSITTVIVSLKGLLLKRLQLKSTSERCV
jgi:hypothetical protein